MTFIGKCRTNQTDNLCMYCNESTFHWLWTFYFWICTRANLLRGSPAPLSTGRMIIGCWSLLWGYWEGPWEIDATGGCQTVKAPEKLGGVGSSLGMKMEKEWGLKLLSSKSQRKNNSLTNVTPARNFPADHKRGIWGLASFRNVMELAMSLTYRAKVDATHI